MPKEIFEIKHFKSGTVTTPDARDVPDDAAVYSSNLDSVVENGKLKSIPNDMKLYQFKESEVSFSGSGTNDLKVVVGTTSRFLDKTLIIRAKGSTTGIGSVDTDTIVDSGNNVDGTYTGISLSGGTGSGAKATVTVATDASATITSVVITTVGTGYAVNDTLTIPTGTLGTQSGGGTVDVASLQNKYDYSVDGGATYKTEALMQTSSANADTIDYGVKIYWNSSGGHTNGDTWTFSGMTTTPVKMRTINNKGVNDLVLYDSADNKMKKVENIYSGTTHGVLSDLASVTSSGNKITMESHNKELHIGTGGKGVTADNENAPKWVGYPSHGQWGDDPPSNMIIEDAEIKAPSSIPIAHKVILMGDYIYAIEWQGTKVYKYKHTDNTFVETGGAFIQATAICQYDDDNILVFDQSSGTNGTLFKLSTDKLNVVSSHPMFDEYRSDATTDIISDMHVTDMGGSNEILWFSIYRGTGGFTSTGQKILLNAPLPTGSGTSVTLTDRTWSMYEVSPPRDVDDVGVFTSFFSINTYKVCLSDAMDSDKVSIILDMNNANIWTKYDNTGNGDDKSDSTGKTAIMVVQKNLTSTGLSNQILFNSSAKAKLFILTKYDDNTAYEDRKVTSAYYSGSKYYIGYHGGTSASDGIFIVYDHSTVASNWANFVLSSDDSPQIPELDAVSSEWTHDNGSPTYVYKSTSGTTLTFRGLSTKNIGQLMTITFDTSSDTVGDETVQSTNDVSILTVANDKAGDLGIKDTTTYQKYKVVYVYDKYQESTLSSEVANVEIDNEKYSIDLEILVKTANLSKRISDINIYRVQSTSSNPSGFYRLVKSIKLDGNWLDNDGTSGNGLTIGAHKSYNYSDTGKLLASYDARNSMSETMENITPHYGLSTQLNSSMIIADCWHISLEDAEQYIFKSKIHKFDTYDWTADFLKLPNIPTALAGFKGRLYAFDSNTMWRINTNGMYIEDTFDGIGCLGPDSIKVTEFGMCFLDKNNIYLHNGQVPLAIGTNIQGYANWPSGTDYSWYNVDFSTYTPKILFDSKRTSFVVLFKSNNSSNYFAWAYNLPRKRWDMWDVDGQPISVMNGEDGRMFLSTNNTIIDYISSGSIYRNWEYVSKIHTFGYDTLDKKIYEIKTIGDDIGIEHYGETSATDVSTLTIPLSDRRQKSMQLKLTGTTVDECDSVSIIYRRMPLTSGNI